MGPTMLTHATLIERKTPKMYSLSYQSHPGCLDPQHLQLLQEACSGWNLAVSLVAWAEVWVQWSPPPLLPLLPALQALQLGPAAVGWRSCGTGPDDSPDFSWSGTCWGRCCTCTHICKGKNLIRHSLDVFGKLRTSYNPHST